MHITPHSCNGGHTTRVYVGVCLRTGRTPETSGADTLRTMDLTLGAYESLETGLPYRVGSTL